MTASVLLIFERLSGGCGPSPRDGDLHRRALLGEAVEPGGDLDLPVAGHGEVAGVELEVGGTGALRLSGEGADPRRWQRQVEGQAHDDLGGPAVGTERGEGDTVRSRCRRSDG